MPEINTNRKFGDWAREKREAIGITPTDAAVIIFGAKKYCYRITDIENGKKDITFKTADKILAAYKSDIEFKEK